MQCSLLVDHVSRVDVNVAVVEKVLDHARLIGLRRKMKWSFACCSLDGGWISESLHKQLHLLLLSLLYERVQWFKLNKNARTSRALRERTYDFHMSVDGSHMKRTCFIGRADMKIGVGIDEDSSDFRATVQACTVQWRVVASS